MTSITLRRYVASPFYYSMDDRCFKVLPNLSMYVCLPRMFGRTVPVYVLFAIADGHAVAWIPVLLQRQLGIVIEPVYRMR
jgi:hypothetical protein